MVVRSSRFTRQDGFIREILWVCLVIAIIAVVLLDGMAIFSAHQSVHDETTTAANVARTEYAQSQSLGAAKQAAEEHIRHSGDVMVAFSSARGAEGTLVFTVEAKATAEPYACKYLKYIPGLKKWVERTTHPVATGTSD